jgi:methylenetetrahydrofolate dehydrogenase (NADP+)/methenyltetrahydrofolate cyclohydrolase
LKAKHYIRYCDDFVILDNSRGLLESFIPTMAEFLQTGLRLDLHPLKIEIRKVRQGVDFLGYVSLPHYRVLRTSTKRRMLKKITSKNASSYLGLLWHCKGEKIKSMISSIIMPARLLSGLEAREARMPALAEKIKKLGRAPVLAIIQVGDREDSSAYIRAKKSFAAKIGVKVEHISIPDSAAESEVISTIDRCNADGSIDGIIVQLPLPERLNRDNVINAVDPSKDADALTSKQEEWRTGYGVWSLMPATARGVRELLDQYGISLEGKKVAIVGRSALVGAPVAEMCRKEGAEVAVCHRGTPDISAETKKADIVIVAAGHPKLIGPECVKPGQVVIDIGINTVAGEKLEDEIAEKKLVGDVDFEAVAPILGDAGAISPVPGGVGPMTVLGLFENLVDLCNTI